MKIIIQVSAPVLRNKLETILSYRYSDWINQDEENGGILITDLKPTKGMLDTLTDKNMQVIFTGQNTITAILDEVQALILKAKDFEAPPILDAYLPIRIETLKEIHTLLEIDLYLKLSNFKYIRIHRKEDSLDPEDLNLYINKKVPHLFFTSRSLEDIIQALSYTPHQSFWEELYRLHAPLLANLGIENETIRVTQDLIQKTLDHTQKTLPLFENEIKRLRLVDNECFLSAHSLLTAIIGIHCLKKLNWSNELNDQKIVSASVLHDLTLPNPELAKYLNQDHLFLTSATCGSDSDVIALSRIDALKIADQIQPNSNDLKQILEYHYGKFKNPGKSLTAKSQLAALFQVSHELAHHTLTDSKFDLIHFFENFSDGKMESQIIERLIQSN